MTPIPAPYAAELALCFELLAGRVFGYARSTFDADVEHANDLVQQAFEVAATRWADLRRQSDTDQLRFLCTVVWCDATDAVRRECTVREKQADVWRVTQHRQGDPFEAVNLHLLVEAFDKEISDMPPKRRRVAELKWGKQLSNREIANNLGITEKAVSSHITAARDALRKVRERWASDPEGGSDR